MTSEGCRGVSLYEALSAVLGHDRYNPLILAEVGTDGEWTPLIEDLGAVFSQSIEARLTDVLKPVWVLAQSRIEALDSC